MMGIVRGVTRGWELHGQRKKVQPQPQGLRRAVLNRIWRIMDREVSHNAARRALRDKAARPRPQCSDVPAPPQRLIGCLPWTGRRSRPHGARRTGRRAGLSDCWRGGMRAMRSGSRGASSAARRWPRRSCRMRCCGSGSTRRAGGRRRRSAPGSIVSSSISASTRSAVRPTCRSMPPAIRPIPRPMRRRAGNTRARPQARRRDRCLAGASARRDRAHLSGRARQRRGRCRARHVGLRRRDVAGPRQARAARRARRIASIRRSA